MRLKPNFALAIGLFSNLISEALRRFIGDFPASNFLQGLFAGISVTLLIYFLYNFGRSRISKTGF